MLAFYEESSEALKRGATIKNILNMEVREKIGRFKYTHPEDVEAEYDKIIKALHQRTGSSHSKGGLSTCQKNIEPYRKLQDL